VLRLGSTYFQASIPLATISLYVTADIDMADQSQKKSTPATTRNPFGDLIQQNIANVPSFTLESGATLKDVPVAYKTWGRLNARADNVLVICHALTGSADVEDWYVFPTLRIEGADVIGGDHYSVLIVLLTLLDSLSFVGMSLDPHMGLYLV
jgi:hypothetical protein